MAEEKAKKLAEDHWKWVETWLHMVYVDAFIHGHKHGGENKKLCIKEGLSNDRKQ